MASVLWENHRTLERYGSRLGPIPCPRVGCTLNSTIEKTLPNTNQIWQTKRFKFKGRTIMALEQGKRFVDFELKNQDGETVKLDDFKGKWLVVYVYPKDDTPGCTIQGKSFTATKQEFDDANIAVVGVSEDDVDSHKDFSCKLIFTIDL